MHIKKLKFIPLGAAFLVAPLFLFLFDLFDWSSISFERLSSIQLIIFSVILYPICEELIFRGVIQAELIKKGFSSKNIIGLSAANVLTSLLFALAHLLYFQNIHALWVFFPSMVFGYFFEQRRKLTLPMLMHGWYNLVGLFGVSWI